MSREGFLGLTVLDLAAATGRSRAYLYEHYGDTVDLLVAAVDLLLVQAWKDPLVRPGTGSGAWEAARTAAVRHRRWYAFEAVARGVALAGVPRARGALARLDLVRLQALRDLSFVHGDLPERIHLVEPLLDACIYRHFVERCGWSEVQYARWLAARITGARDWNGHIDRASSMFGETEPVRSLAATEEWRYRDHLTERWLESERAAVRTPAS